MGEAAVPGPHSKTRKFSKASKRKPIVVSGRDEIAPPARPDGSHQQCCSCSKGSVPTVCSSNKGPGADPVVPGSPGSTTISRGVAPPTPAHTIRREPGVFKIISVNTTSMQKPSTQEEVLSWNADAVLLQEMRADREGLRSLKTAANMRG